MNTRKVARIEAQARQMRAELLVRMFRNLFNRAPQPSVAGARTA